MNEEKLITRITQLTIENSRLIERNEFLEEQHENDELAIEYYKRAECPFYQHEGKCVDEPRKADFKDIRDVQWRRKRSEKT